MADEFADWAVTALSALAHESRLQVHRLLVQAGQDGLSAGAIAEQLGLPASSLSFHLAHMQAAEMVNQIGGTIKRYVGADGNEMMLSPPVVVSGSPLSHCVRSSQKPLNVDLDLGQGSFGVCLWPA